jgi:ribosome-binding factor A
VVRTRARKVTMVKSNSRSPRGDDRDDDRGGGKPHSSPRTKPRTDQPRTASGPSQRQLRVGEMIRHELAALLSRGEIHDEVLAASVVTIPEVRMSTDLKLATVYVMPLGGLNVAGVIAALNTHKKYIRTVIAKAINLKYAPDVTFAHDKTFDEALRIDKLLNLERVRRDIEK